MDSSAAAASAAAAINGFGRQRKRRTEAVHHSTAKSSIFTKYFGEFCYLGEYENNEFHNYPFGKERGREQGITSQPDDADAAYGPKSPKCAGL